MVRDRAPENLRDLGWSLCAVRNDEGRIASLTTTALLFEIHIDLVADVVIPLAVRHHHC
jgi:hypothetical protein